MTILINSLEQLMGKYNALLVDMCGVLHDGGTAYEGVNEALTKYNNMFEIMLFSNSPRIISESQKQLTKYGVDYSNVNISTSGEYFIDQLKSIVKAGDKLYILGADKNPQLTTKIAQITEVSDNISETSYITILDYSSDLNAINTHDGIFKKAIKNSVVALCPNPDKIALSQGAKSCPQGAFAARFEELGGQVIYFGKPTKGFYEYAVGKMKHQDRSRILAIGDNMETDILGAHNYGIDSALIFGTGIYQDIKDTQSIYHDNKNSIAPTYLISRFR